MAGPKTVGIPKQPFDEAKFATMTEPFSIRIEKIRGSQRQPIPLPRSDEDPNLAEGEGWSRENVRGLENWLVTEWAGGGLYEVSIVDSAGVSMKWSPFWDPKTYPDKIPLPLQETARQAPAPVIPLLQPQPAPQVARMSAFPNGLPFGLNTMTQAPQYNPGQGPYTHYQMPPPPPAGTFGYAQWKNDAEERRREDELKQLRDREAQREREALEAKHRADLERVGRDNDARFQAQANQMNELRTMITQLTQTLTQAQQKPVGESPEVAQLKSELALQRTAMEAQAREREAERRDAAMRDAIRISQEAMQKQIELLTKQFEQQAQIAREAGANRHDPIVLMIERMQTQHADAIKTLATESRLTMERMQSFVMTPQTMIDLAQRQSQATDGVTEKLTRTFGSVLDMQQKVVENAMQLAPQGSGAIDLAREGIDRLTGLVDKYTTTKSMEQRFMADAQVKVVQAQAAYAQAQAFAAQPHAHVPPAPQPQAQLAGPSVPQSAPAARAVSATGARPVERFGRTDDVWFGPLMPEVQRLRDGAKEFIDSLNMKPPRVDKDGDPVGVSPEQATMAILQAAQICIQRNVVVDALSELLMVDRFEDFVSVVLPDATKVYQDEVVKLLVQTAREMEQHAIAMERQMSGGAEPASTTIPVEDVAAASDDGENDGDDSGDDDDDDGESDAVAAAPPVAAASRKVQQNRRAH